MRTMQGAVLLVGLTLSLGCSGDPVGIQVPNPSFGQALIATPAAASADLVAKAIAMGLNDGQLRSGLRSAMRMSQVTEHKLVLQDFAATPTGAALLSVGAQKLGITTDSIARTIASLPALDFYVPNQNQRKSWHGDGSILVGAAMGPDRSVYLAHSSDGSSIRVAGAAFAPAHAVFLLHPAERKAIRIDPQGVGAGATIEDANDGEIGGSIVEYLPNGSTRVTELASIHSSGKGSSPRIASLSVGCGVDGSDCDGSGGGGSGEPADTTFLENLVIIDVCDNDNCDETNEFEWHTYISHDNGATFSGRVDLRLVGISSDFQATVHQIALFAKPQLYSDDLIETDVVETDGISPSDDYGGARWHNGTFSSPSENNQIRSLGDDLRCDYVDNNGFPWHCDQGVFWRDVNQSMLWRNP